MCPFLTSIKGLGYGQKPDPLKIQAHYCSLVHSLVTSRPCCKWQHHKRNSQLLLGELPNRNSK